jgi:hypothetical protein
MNANRQEDPAAAAVRCPAKRARRRLVRLAVPLCLLCGPAAYGADVGMDVEANREEIYLGESVNLTIRVSGNDTVLTPDLSAVRDARVRFIGSHSQSRSSVSFINGAWSRTEFRGRLYTYQLTPTTSGVFRAGPVQLDVNGTRLTDPGPVVRVRGVERQDVVAVALEASRETVLVDEPFEIALSVTLKRLPPPYADADPLDPARPPTLRAGYLDGAPIAGLDPPDIRGALQGRLVAGRREPGFALNDYTVQHSPLDLQSMFDFEDMMGRRPARFRLDRDAVTVNGAPAFRYSLRFTFVPAQEGSYTFGPAVFKGEVLTGVGADKTAITRPIFAVGPALTVRVVPPPEAGRPATYIGAIGTDLTIKTELDARTCTVGDPLTLTLSLQGNVRMENIQPPVLGAQTNLARRFRILDETVRPLRPETGRAYAYTLRPTEAGTIEFPPVAVSYYDTDARAYRTVASQPLPLRVNPAAEVGEDSIIDTVAGRADAADGGGLVVAPMTLTPLGAQPQPLAGGRWTRAVLVGAPALFGLTWIGRGLVRLVRRRRARSRRRGALRRARAALRRADGRERGAALNGALAALRAYLRDRFDAADAAGLTPADARRLLTARGVPAAAADRFTAVFERVFNAAYAAGDAAPVSAAVLIETLTALEEAARKHA